eukprot:CAMPEP_0197250210 /NCGR_PEP_ID=MMETSP1429-20130617/51784_1 /TAXON_ID=49237 /ORGANISM="Chaetoceros  sp., Strain UNC1202" /LENGTH=79 /DNA_ID=CAMNT_0042711985 /DNA_START=39 /DNA_END=275 /DNA_ORIENTATION=+
MKRNYTEVTWKPSGVKDVTLNVNEGRSRTDMQALARVKKAQANLQAQLDALHHQKSSLSSTYKGLLNMQETALQEKLEQ